MNTQSNKRQRTWKTLIASTIIILLASASSTPSTHSSPNAMETGSPLLPLTARLTKYFTRAKTN